MAGDLGLGSPSTWAPDADAGPSDTGLGSPSAWAPDADAGEFDLGLGSPSPPAVFGVAGQLGPYPDEGGVPLELLSSWPVTGPYQVRAVDADGNEWPASGGFYSCRPGSGDDCRTDRSKRKLLCALPPLPPGSYTLIARWGPELADEAVSEAFLVVRRGRCDETYRLRRRFQSLFVKGPVSHERAPLLEG
jgi:hypothetical protein